MAVGVGELQVEWFEAAKPRQADASCRNRADIHSFHIIGACDTVGDIPATLHDPLVGGDIISHEAEDHHDYMFGYADRVAVGHFGHRHTAVHCGLQIDM